MFPHLEEPDVVLVGGVGEDEEPAVAEPEMRHGGVRRPHLRPGARPDGNGVAAVALGQGLAGVLAPSVESAAATLEQVAGLAAGGGGEAQHLRGETKVSQDGGVGVWTIVIILKGLWNFLK